MGRFCRKLTDLDVLDFWRSDDGGGCGGNAEAEDVRLKMNYTSIENERTPYSDVIVDIIVEMF